MRMRLHKQQGSTLVEMAIVLILFLMVVFAVMEFSIATYRAAQLSDATREGLRYAIVNDPMGTLPTCPGGGTISVDASPEMVNRIANFAPIINNQDDIEIKVEYSCPSSGYIGGDDVYLVTVRIYGAKHYLTVPEVLGLNVAIELSEFKATRISEDLHTEVQGE